MSVEEISQFLLTNEEFFTTNNIVINVFRWLGWMLVKLLRSALEAGVVLYDYTFGLVDITSWTNLNDFIEQFRPLISGLVLLSLVVLGFMFILGKHKNHTVLSSFLIFAVVMTSSNYIFSELNTLAVSFKDAVVSSDEQEDANALVNANLYDLLYVDSAMGLRNMSPDNVAQYDQISSQEINYIDINEVVNYKSEHLTTDDAKEILKQRILYIHGDPTVREVSNGWGWNSEDDADLGNEFYYRYHFRFGTFYLTIVSLILVLFCLAYKNVRIIYELFVSKIMIALFATDMSSNQKAVKILASIRDGYYALCFTAITLRSFTIFTSYLGTRTEIGGVVRAIIILFITFCVIDGANIMEKITGVDAGLTGMTGKIITGIQLTRSMQQGIQQSHIGQQMRQQGAAISNLQNQNQADSRGGMNGGESDTSQNNRYSQDNLNSQSSMENQDNPGGHEGFGQMNSEDAASNQRNEMGQSGGSDWNSQEHESSMENLNSQNQESAMEDRSSQDQESSMEDRNNQENESSMENLDAHTNSVEENMNYSGEESGSLGAEESQIGNNNLDQEDGTASTIDQEQPDNLEQQPRSNEELYGSKEVNPYDATEKSMEQMSRDLEKPENKYQAGENNRWNQNLDKDASGFSSNRSVPQNSAGMFQKSGDGGQQAQREPYPLESQTQPQNSQYPSDLRRKNPGSQTAPGTTRTGQASQKQQKNFNQKDL